jgi:tetratricopeptide (TPR) repeat protein
MSMVGSKWNGQWVYSVSERAYLLHTEGRHREALTLFEGLLEIDPLNLYYRDAVSALHLALDEPEAAVRQASIVLAVDPNYKNAIVRRCEGYIRLAMHKEAEDDLEKLRRVGSNGDVRRMEMRLEAAERAQPQGGMEK